MPKGLKPVRRKLATGEVRLYWYHRATGKALTHDPETAEGHIEVAGLDAKAKAINAVSGHQAGSLAGLWTAYRDSPEWRSLKPRTRSDYQAVRDWLGDGAERAVVKLIKTEDVLRLRDKAAKQRGRRFGNYTLQVIRLVLEWGRPRGWLTVNPAMGMKQIRKPIGYTTTNRAWTAAEIDAYTLAAPPHLLLPFTLGLFAGMREGDALVLTWAGYDGGMVRWIAGKNGEHCAAPASGVFKAILDDAKAARDNTLQVCLNSYGAAWSESGFRASFFKLLAKLKAAGKIQPGCTFHGLRHTIGTLARDGQESEFRIAAAIGDRSTAMAQIYGRDADRHQAQTEVLAEVQKRFANIEWKTRLENASEKAARKKPQPLMGEVVPGGGFEPPTRGFSIAGFGQGL